MSQSTGELIYYAVAIAVSSLAARIYLSHYRDRARRHDHVVRASRDVALPDHCAWCGRAHASIKLSTVPRFIGVGPYQISFNSKFRKKYDFLYCPDCAKVIRRRRTFAKRVMLASFIFVVHFVGILLTVALLPKGTYFDFPRGSLWAILFHPGFLLVDIFGWGILFIAGTIGLRYSPAVKIIDNGDEDEQVFYRFANQVYRNHFAQLNGAR